MDAKARFLYSLFDEAIKLGKGIDSKHPFGIVNGDLGYLAQIAELCPDLDILGVNTYRGRKAYSAFYASIDETLDKPFVFTEFGADAFNIKTGQEDQIHQAEFLHDQWEELYSEAYGKGKSQNALGGFVFEWIDEWWKHGMDTGLDVHDTEGTWTNGAYDFDATPGVNNMNEEWFGIVGQSELTYDGIHRRLPRAAYYLLQKIWTLDFYKSTPKQVKDSFAAASIAEAAALADPLVVRNALDERQPYSIQANVESRSFATATGEGLGALSDIDGLKSETTFRTVSAASIDLTLRPIENLSGGLEVKAATPSGYYDFSSTTASALGKPLSWFTDPAAFTWQLSAEGEPIELYAAWADFESAALKADFYYRTGHADWGLSGDFFGFLPEAFDRYTMDLNKQSAPFGLEISPKGLVDGLTIYGGPELYAGAMPSVMIKYYREIGNWSFGAIHDEELWYPDGSADSPSQVPERATEIAEWEKKPLTRRSSLYAQADYLPVIDVQAGLMLGSPEKIGETFTNAIQVAAGSGSAGTGYDVYVNQKATLLDALGAKLRLSTALVPYVVQAYAQGIYMGPLANSEAAVARSGSFIFDPGVGNRIDGEAGLTAVYGDFALSPKFLYRRPVYDALPTLTALGIAPRTYTDLFNVDQNREAVEGELVACYDPEGGTYFFDWNNDDREGAPFAASISFLYDFYLGPTDCVDFVADDYGTVYSFNAGLSAISGTWALKAKAVWRPEPSLRLIANAEAGRAQSAGDPTQPVADYVGGTLRVVVDRLMLTGGALP